MKPNLPLPRTCNNCGAPVTREQNCLWCGVRLTKVKTGEIPAQKRGNLFQYISLIIVAVAIAMLLVFLQEFQKSTEKQGRRLISNIRFAQKNSKEMITLRKNLLTFMANNHHLVPDALDSMVTVDNLNTLTSPHYIQHGLAADRLVLDRLPPAIAYWLSIAGMRKLGYYAAAGSPVARKYCGGERCLRSAALYEPPPEGCPAMFWKKGKTLLTGQPAKQPYNADGNTAYLVLGIDENSSLFDPGLPGTLEHPPTFALTGPWGYDLYLSVWAVGKYKDGKIVRDENLNRPELIKILGSHGETAKEIVVEANTGHKLQK